MNNRKRALELLVDQATTTPNMTLGTFMRVLHDELAKADPPRTRVRVSYETVQSRRETVQAFYEANPDAPLKVAAAHLGLSAFTVSNDRAALGFKWKSGSGARKLAEPSPKAAAMIDMARQIPTPTLEEISQKFGVTRETVRSTLKRWGFVKPKLRGGPKTTTVRDKAIKVAQRRKARKAVQRDRAAAIRRMYEAGALLADIDTAIWGSGNGARTATFIRAHPHLFSGLRRRHKGHRSDLQSTPQS
jgi:hypothetical protein